MKKLFFILIFYSSLMQLSAQAPALTFGTWSFVPGNPEIPPGLYAYSGAAFPLSGRIEIEPMAVCELASKPFRNTMLGAAVNYLLLGDRNLNQFNILLDAGYIRTLPQSINILNTDDINLRLVYLRIAPLTIGNSHYGSRDRLFSLGLAWDLDNQIFSVIWNVMILEIF